MLLIRSGEDGTKGSEFPFPSFVLDFDTLGDKNGMLFVPKGSFASHVLQQGIPDKPFLQWVREKFAKPDKICIDIGANVGEFALAVAPGFSHTYCFHPSDVSELRCYLYANIALYHMHDTISVLNSSELERISSKGNIGLLKITMAHLHLSFLKSILGIEVLQRSLPPILFRISGDDKNLQHKKEVFAYIESVGYAIIEIRGPKDMFLAISK